MIGDDVMLYDTISKFTDDPNDNTVNDLVFYSDIDLSHLSIKERYESLIKAGKFNDAINYLRQQSDVHCHCADFFNMIANRLINLESYLKNKIVYNPHYFSSAEPEGVKTGEMWIDLE